MESDWIGLSGLIVGVVGAACAVGSEVARRSQRHWVHIALVNLKPSIDGPNRQEVLASIDNMLNFLKPPKKVAGYDG